MSEINKQWLGLPLNLLWGYLAIAVFMTGDGFELAFLSHYIKSLGFTPAEASFVVRFPRPVSRFWSGSGKLRINSAVLWDPRSGLPVIFVRLHRGHYS